MERRHNPVFRSLNRPLTLMGAERKLFFFALKMGAGVFVYPYTLLTIPVPTLILGFSGSILDARPVQGSGRSER